LHNKGVWVVITESNGSPME